MTIRSRLTVMFLACLVQASLGFVKSCCSSRSHRAGRLQYDWQTSKGSCSRRLPQHFNGLCMSSQTKDNDKKILEDERPNTTTPDEKPLSDGGPFQLIENLLPRVGERPPIQVDDQDLLLYDVFLLINLSVSISFWVVHRLQVGYLGLALNEGCLLAMCWIAAGLWNGVFLYSALDGHHRSSDDEAGPQAAGLLALNTFVWTINLRLLFALLVAVVQHRPAGGAEGELLMPLELGLGLVLMSAWRALHSSMVPRL